MARVLIGIPTWNRPALVREAILSAQAQTFTDIRILVSDNDSGPEVAGEIAAFVASLEDPRIEFVQQLENCGENGQTQYLLEQCVEDYMMVLHDDDRLEPDLLAAAVACLDQHPEIDLFSTNQYLFDEAGDLLEAETASYNAELMRDRLVEGEIEGMLELVLQRMMFALSGSLFRTESLRECGLEDSPDTYPFDFNVMLRQAENGKRVWWDSRKLVGFRWHAGQARKTSFWEFNESHIKGFMRIVEPRRYTGGAESKRRWLLAFSYRRYAYIQFVAGRYLDGYRYLGKAVKEDPLHWRLWVYVGFALAFPFLIKPLWGGRTTLAAR